MEHPSTHSLQEPEGQLKGACRAWKHESLLAFRSALRRLGSDLVCRRGEAAVVLRSLWQEQLGTRLVGPMGRQAGVRGDHRDAQPAL